MAFKVVKVDVVGAFFQSGGNVWLVGFPAALSDVKPFAVALAFCHDLEAVIAFSMEGVLSAVKVGNGIGANGEVVVG